MSQAVASSKLVKGAISLLLFALLGVLVVAPLVMVVVTAFIAATQAFSVAIPETGLPRLLFSVFLLVLLVNTLAASPDRVRVLRSVLVIFGSAFVLKFIVLAALSDPAGGWLKRVLLVIVPFWSLMTAATAWASGATSLFVVRFAFGLGEAGAFPTASRAMQLWFPKSERGFVQGMTHCFSRFAVVITPLLAVMIMNAWGWRWIFYIFAVLGIVWSLVFFFFYRNRPEDEARVNAEELAHIRGTLPNGEINRSQRRSDRRFRGGRFLPHRTCGSSRRPMAASSTGLIFMSAGFRPICLNFAISP